MKLELLRPGILTRAFTFFISTQECPLSLGQMAQAFLYTLPGTHDLFTCN